MNKYVAGPIGGDQLVDKNSHCTTGPKDDYQLLGTDQFHYFCCYQTTFKLASAPEPGSSRYPCHLELTWGIPDPGPHAVDCRPTMLPKDALHLTGQIIRYNTDLRLTAYPPGYHLTYMFSRFTRNPGIRWNSNSKRCTFFCCNQTTFKFRVLQLVHKDIISSKLNDN